MYHSGCWASQILIQAKTLMRNKRDPGAWGSSLTKSGVEFVELDGRTEAARQCLPGIANDRRKEVGVEEVTDEEQLQPIRQDAGR